MKRIAVIAALMLLAACAAHGPSQVTACQDRVERLYPSSMPGVRVQRAEGMRDCARATGTSNAFTEEFHAYWIYLAHEVEAGRMSEAEARYLLAQKNTQLESQIRGLAASQPQQPAYRPVVPQQQRSPIYTNCTTDPWGNTNCTTQ